MQRLAISNDFQIARCTFPRIAQETSQLFRLITDVDFLFGLGLANHLGNGGTLRPTPGGEVFLILRSLR